VFLRIALITPEFHSLVRRTNLAGVAESLANALHGARQEVGVFLPHTLDVDIEALDNLEERGEIRVPDGPGGTRGGQRFRITRGELGGIPIYLFENDLLFGRRHPYGDHEGPYPDNWRRYALFSQAVLGSFDTLQFMPDVLHCMDWTTGLLPLYHRLRYVEAQPDHPLSAAGTYFAIHNLAMQGVFEREILPHVGIPHRYFRHVEGLELAGRVNFMKAGAEFATIVGTHSPGHAQKIQERDRGYGLEETFLRRKKELIGISNGIDYQAWNPENDPALPAPFGPSDRDFAGKRKAKSVLQAQLRLDNGPRTPIAVTMGRWDADGGFDLVAEVLTEILERNVELVCMGQGSPEMTQRLATWEGAFVGRMRVIDGYEQRTAHLLLGGADILMLPSHYQPANPLFAIGMRYGVVPIVYARSGLEDQVPDYASDKRGGLGFQFQPYTAEGLMESVTHCLATYKEQDKWRQLVRRCLAQNLSWEATAEEYLKAYRRVTRRTKSRAS
jgi:starch synthase